jgi:DNA-binding response OmpR family regulator
MSKSILVVEDDPVVETLITELLGADGYAVQSAATLFRARGAVERTPPDLIILDRNLPDGDGLDFCRELKKEERTQGIPILFLSAAEKSPGQRVKGLEAGADDYLVKPFNNAELVSRVKTILRRAYGPPPVKFVLTADSLRLDVDARKVTAGPAEIALSEKEFDLLRAFLERPDRVLSRDALIQLVWGEGRELELAHKGVDVVVSNLKKKLGQAGTKIDTVRGIGFRFNSKTHD